jgi:6-phosphogluconolactonase
MASLFPGSPQLEVTGRRATDGPAGLEPWVHRVTFTVPTIQAARHVVFLVSGSGKAEAVARAFGGDISAEVPASLSRRAPRVEIFLDRAAGDKLDGR